MYISWRSGLFCLILLQANTLFISILMQNTLLKPSFWHKWAAGAREKADKVPNSRQQDPQLMSKKIWITVPLFWWGIFLVVDVRNAGLGEGLVWVGGVTLQEGVTDWPHLQMSIRRDPSISCQRFGLGWCELHSYSSLLWCYSLPRSHNVNPSSPWPACLFPSSRMPWRELS